MKVPLTLLALLVLNFTAIGQHTAGFKLNVGLSKISTSLENPTPSATYQTKFAPSGSVGGYYSIRLNNKSYLEAELLFMQIEGREDSKHDLFNGSDKIGERTSTGYTHISYLTIPISYGLRFNKITTLIGFQASYALASSGKVEGQTNEYGTITNWTNKYDDLGIEDFDWGLKLGLLYELSNRYTIESSYYHGLNDLLNSSCPDCNNVWKVRQVTIGLRYKMWSSINN